MVLKEYKQQNLKEGSSEDLFEKIENVEYGI